MSRRGERSALRRLLTAGLVAASMAAAAQFGFVGTASAAVPTPTVKIGFSALKGAENFKSATATCAAGQVVLGAGFKIVNGGPDVVLDDLIVFEDHIEVGAFEKGSVTGPDLTRSWSLEAHAVCASRPNGYEIKQASGQFSTVNGAIQTATCSPGKRAIGGGVELFGSQGQVSVDELFPLQNGYQGKGFEDQDGNRDSAGNDRAWGLNVRVICAFADATIEFPTSQGAQQSGSSSTEIGFVKCSRGDQHLTGTGWDLIQGNGQVHLVQVLPGLKSQNTLMSEDADGHSLNWQWNELAICA